MLIRIGSHILEQGYQKIKDPRFVSPFFPGMNVAFRKSAITEVGKYNEELITGEDRDISLRLLDSNWKVFFEPKAEIVHKSRETAIGVIKQWYGYSKFQAKLAKLHGCHGLIVMFSYDDKHGAYQSKVLCWIRKFPFDSVIYLSPFLFAHLFLASYFISLLTNLSALVQLSFQFLTIFSFAYYFKSDLTWKTLKDKITIGIFRYALNMVIILESFIGGLKCKTFFISDTSA